MGFAMLMAAGAGLSAVSTVAGGIAGDKMGKFNAKVQEDQADFIDTKTAADVGALRRNFDKFRGSLRGDIAAFGGNASSGTGLLLAQQAAEEAKLDELNLITDGTNSANAARMGASVSRYEGKVKKTQGILGGFGQALKGFGQYQQATG